MASLSELDQLFVNDTPLIDVRAPVEFDRGAFPSARNLPILDDAEREQVGTCYRRKGAAAAERLGFELVSGELREQRIAAWADFVAEQPNAHLYCFRGGQRSMIACQWLSAAGHDVPRIEGGYKRMRNHLMAVFDRLPPLVVVAGKTGTGKTEFLAPFDAAIDLEGIARHRGSAFGGRIQPQPVQIDFENWLAVAFLRRMQESFVLLEDEGRLIGRINVPPVLQERMKQAPLVLIEETIGERVQRIHDEYITRQWQDYTDSYGDDAPARFAEYLLGAVDAIRKRLGNVAHGEIRGLIEDALALQQGTGDQSGHRTWIERLLVDYYDPMYEYQLEKKLDRVVVRGSHTELGQWLEEHREQPA